MDLSSLRPFLKDLKQSFNCKSVPKLEFGNEDKSGYEEFRYWKEVKSDCEPSTTDRKNHLLTNTCPSMSFSHEIQITQCQMKFYFFFDQFIYV